MDWNEQDGLESVNGNEAQGGRWRRRSGWRGEMREGEQRELSTFAFPLPSPPLDLPLAVLLDPPRPRSPSHRRPPPSACPSPGGARPRFLIQPPPFPPVSLNHPRSSRPCPVNDDRCHRSAHSSPHPNRSRFEAAQTRTQRTSKDAPNPLPLPFSPFPSLISSLIAAFSSARRTRSFSSLPPHAPPSFTRQSFGVSIFSGPSFASSIRASLARSANELPSSSLPSLPPSPPILLSLASFPLLSSPPAAMSDEIPQPQEQLPSQLQAAQDQTEVQGGVKVLPARGSVERSAEPESRSEAGRPMEEDRDELEDEGDDGASTSTDRARSPEPSTSTVSAAAEGEAGNAGDLVMRNLPQPPGSKTQAAFVHKCVSHPSFRTCSPADLYLLVGSTRTPKLLSPANRNLPFSPSSSQNARNPLSATPHLVERGTHSFSFFEVAR